MLFSEIPFPRLLPVQGGKTTPLHPAKAVRERRKRHSNIRSKTYFTICSHFLKLNIYAWYFAFYAIKQKRPEVQIYRAYIYNITSCRPIPAMRINAFPPRHARTRTLSLPRIHGRTQGATRSAKNIPPLSPDMNHARSGGDVEPKPTNAGRIGSRTPPGTFAALLRQRKPLPLRVRAL